jgi:hypothetical protein
LRGLSNPVFRPTFLSRPQIPHQIVLETPLRQDLSYSVRKVIARALEQGYVTHDALNAALPPDEYTNEEIEDLTAMLTEKGIALREREPEETMGQGVAIFAERTPTKVGNSSPATTGTSAQIAFQYAWSS